MKQLTGLDTSFLNMETSTQFGHVNSITIVDPSSMVGGDPYATFKRTVEARLHLLEIYRRKLVADPLGLDNPYWVDDPDLDLEFHIREIALAGTRRRSPAGGAGGPARRTAARSHPPALGVVRDQRARGRAGRAVHEAAPRHHRRRLRGGAAPRAPRHRARGQDHRTTERAVGAGAHAHPGRAPAARPVGLRHAPPQGAPAAGPDAEGDGRHDGKPRRSVGWRPTWCAVLAVVDEAPPNRPCPRDRRRPPRSTGPSRRTVGSRSARCA